MPFQLDTMLLAVVLAVVLIALLLIAWRINVGRELAEGQDHQPKSLEQLEQAKLEPGEGRAALIVEQVEEMVRTELAETNQSKVNIDFSTAADGSLRIIFNGQEYSDPMEFPDARVRQAVLRAVNRFNQQEGTGIT